MLALELGYYTMAFFFFFFIKFQEKKKNHQNCWEGFVRMSLKQANKTGYHLLGNNMVLAENFVESLHYTAVKYHPQVRVELAWGL